MKCLIASHIVTFKIIVQFYEFFSKSYLLYFLLILLICSFHIFNTLFHNLKLFIHFTGTFSRVFHIYFLFCSFYVISHFFWFAARTNCHDKNSNFLQKKRKKICANYFFFFTLLQKKKKKNLRHLLLLAPE